jgi:hypothetical protein
VSRIPLWEGSEGETRPRGVGRVPPRSGWAGDALQPGRLPVLAALIVAMAAAGLLALVGAAPWRWGALWTLAHVCRKPP